MLSNCSSCPFCKFAHSHTSLQTPNHVEVAAGVGGVNGLDRCCHRTQNLSWSKEDRSLITMWLYPLLIREGRSVCDGGCVGERERWTPRMTQSRFRRTKSGAGGSESDEGGQQRERSGPEKARTRRRGRREPPDMWHRAQKGRETQRCPESNWIMFPQNYPSAEYKSLRGHMHFVFLYVSNNAFSSFLYAHNTGGLQKHCRFPCVSVCGSTKKEVVL